MISWFVATFIITCMLFNFAIPEREHKLLLLFENYKNKYHRTYRNRASEAEGYHNFKINYKKITQLNSEDKYNPAYELNKYADVNPNALRQRYHESLKPYTHIKNTTVRKQREEIKPEPITVTTERSFRDDILFPTWFKKLGDEEFSKQFDRLLNNYNFTKQVADLKKKGEIGNFKSRLNSKLLNSHTKSFSYTYDNVSDSDTMDFKDLLRFGKFVARFG